MIMDALKEETLRFRIESGSLTYQANTPSSVHQEPSGQEWDDTTGSRDAGRTLKNKREKHAELVASVLPQLLSPAFKDELLKLERTQVRDYLDTFLQKASLSVADPSARRELLGYLKQVLRAIHGIQVPDSPQHSSAGSPGPEQQDTHTADQLGPPTATAATPHVPSTPGAGSPYEAGAAHASQVSPYPVPSSTSMHTPAASTPLSAANTVLADSIAEACAPTSRPGSTTSAAVIAAATAAASLPSQADLMQRLSGHAGNQAQEFAAIISAAASAATTAAAAAMAGVWSSHPQGGAAWPSRPPLHPAPPPPPAPPATDPFHILGAHPGPPLHPAAPSSLAPGQATPQPRALHTVPAPFARPGGLRVVKLGQPRITAKAVPLPGGDSPAPAEFHRFRSHAPGEPAHASPGVASAWPLPQVNPVAPPPIHPDPFITTTRFLPHQQVGSQPAGRAQGLQVWEQQLGSPDPFPRPPFRPAGVVPADTQQQQQQVAQAPTSPAKHVPSPEATARQLQAQAAARGRWDAAQGSYYANTGIMPPASPPRPTRPARELYPTGILSPPHAAPTVAPAAGVASPGRDMQRGAQLPAPPIRAHITSTPRPAGKQRPVRGGLLPSQQPQAMAQSPAAAALTRQPVPLPQELQGTFQRTLDYLADPDAVPPPRSQALARSSWPPPDHDRHMLERSTAEREVAGRLGGVLEYGRLVQELEEARQRSRLLRHTPATLDTHLGPADLDAAPAPARAHQTAPAAGTTRSTETEQALARLKRIQRGTTSALLDRGASRPQPAAQLSNTAPAAVHASTRPGVAAHMPVEPVLPPAHSLWEEEAAWLDSSAYLQALQREIWFRTSQPVQAQPSQAEPTKAAAATLRPSRASGTGNQVTVVQGSGVGAVMQPSHQHQAARELVVVGMERRAEGKAQQAGLTSGGRLPAAALGPAATQRAVVVASKPRQKVQLAFGRRVEAGSGRTGGQPHQPTLNKTITSQRAPGSLHAQALHHLSQGGPVPQQLIDALVDTLLFRQQQQDAEEESEGREEQTGPQPATSATPVQFRRGAPAQRLQRTRGSVASSDAMSRVLSALASVLADEDVDLSSEQDLADWAHELLHTPTARQLLEGVTQQQAAEQQDTPSRAQPAQSGAAGAGRVQQLPASFSHAPSQPSHPNQSPLAASPTRARGTARPQFLHVQDIRPAAALPAPLPPLYHVHEPAPPPAVPHMIGAAWPQPQPSQPLAPAASTRADTAPRDAHTTTSIPALLTDAYPPTQHLSTQELSQPAGRPPLHPSRRTFHPPGTASPDDGAGAGAHEVLSASVPRAGLYGDASPLGVLTDLAPSHPAATTLLEARTRDAARGAQVFEQAVLDLLVEEVLHQVVLEGRAGAGAGTPSASSLPPGVHQISTLPAQQPPLIPIITDAHLSYQLVRDVLRQELDQLLAPISQDQPGEQPATAQPAADAPEVPPGSAHQPGEAAAAAAGAGPLSPRTSHNTNTRAVGSSTASSSRSEQDVSGSVTEGALGDDEGEGGGDAGQGDVEAALQAGAEAQAAAVAAINAAEQAAAAGRLSSSGGSVVDDEGSRAQAGARADKAGAATPRAHTPGRAAGAPQPINGAQAGVSHQIITMQVPMPYPVPYLTPGFARMLPPHLTGTPAHPGLTAHQAAAAGTFLTALPWAPAGQPPELLPAGLPADLAHLTAPSHHGSRLSSSSAGRHTAAGSRPRAGLKHKIPGLDQLLYDSTELCSSDDDQEGSAGLTAALHTATRMQAVATASAAGKAPRASQGSDNHLALTRSFQEASLETLLAPAPVIPGAQPTRAGAAASTAVAAAAQQTAQSPAKQVIQPDVISSAAPVLGSHQTDAGAAAPAVTASAAQSRSHAHQQASSSSSSSAYSADEEWEQGTVQEGNAGAGAGPAAATTSSSTDPGSSSSSSSSEDMPVLAPVTFRESDHDDVDGGHEQVQLDDAADSLQGREQPAPALLEVRAPEPQSASEGHAAPAVMHMMSGHAAAHRPVSTQQQQQQWGSEQATTQDGRMPGGEALVTRLAASGLHSVDQPTWPAGQPAVSLTSTPPRPTQRHRTSSNQQQQLPDVPPSLADLPTPTHRLWRPQPVQPAVWSSNDSLLMTRHSEASGEASSRSSEGHTSLIPAVHVGQAPGSDSSDSDDSSAEEHTTTRLPSAGRPTTTHLPRLLR